MMMIVLTSCPKETCRKADTILGETSAVTASTSPAATTSEGATTLPTTATTMEQTTAENTTAASTLEGATSATLSPTPWTTSVPVTPAPAPVSQPSSPALLCGDHAHWLGAGAGAGCGQQDGSKVPDCGQLGAAAGMRTSFYHRHEHSECSCYLHQM